MSARLLSLRCRRMLNNKLHDVYIIFVVNKVLLSSITKEKNSKQRLKTEMICQAEAASSLKVMDIHHNEQGFF